VIRRLTPRWRICATLAVLVLPPLVHLLSLDRIVGWIERSTRRRSADPTVDDAALAEWVDRVLARLPPPWKRTCLKRAIVLHYMIRRAGRSAELRIGVRRDEHSALAAHAWLVRNDEPYLEEGADHLAAYQVLAAFPAPEEKHL